MSEAPLLLKEPVVNRNRETVGYSMSLLSESGERAPVGGISALLARTAEFGSFFDRLPAHFVLADASQVESERPLVGSGRYVLELLNTDGVEDISALARTWRGAGYGLCLDLTSGQEWPTEVIQQCAFARVDLQHGGDQLRGRLRGFSGKYIARGVSTNSSFDAAVRAGFDLCQGYFFTEPKGGHANAVGATYSSIVALMKLAKEDAPIGRIEEVLKRDAALSFRLLRYINSAGFGLSCEIQSFRHAVTVLGYQNLHKWLALLLVTAAKKNASSALVTTAIARGRLAELLGHDLFDAQDRDNLFITGAFSLLHVILQMPLEQITEQVTLGEAVNEALFQRTGPYGPLLELVERLERLSQSESVKRASDLAMSLNLTHDEVNRAQLEAQAWAEGLSR